MLQILIPLVAALLVAAPSRPADEKYVKLALADGRVLSVENDSDDSAAQAVAAKEGDSLAQQWRVVEDGKHFKLVNRKNGKLLDVNEDSKDEGARVIIYDEKGEDNDNQRWSWDGKGKARRLTSKSSGLVLDVDGDGKVVQNKADDKAKGQLWTVKEVK